MRRVMILQAATFALVVISVVVFGVTSHRQTAHIGRVANSAKTASTQAKRAAAKANAAAKTAKQAAKLVATANAANHKLRAQQIAALHTQSVKDCGDIHKLANVFETYLSRTITAPALTLPDLTPAQKKALGQIGIQSIKQQKKLLAQIDAADCKNVKRLPSGVTG